MNITYRKISELKPYKNNAKKHPKDQVERIAESIRQFGFMQPVVIDKNNVVVVGHGRILGAKKAGLKEIPTVCAEDLTEEQVKAYRLVDNKLNESPWDIPLLDVELGSIADIEMEVFGFTKKDEEERKKYTALTKVPQYEIKGDKPKLDELVNKTKTKELLEHIKESNIPEDVKAFLKLASFRHLVFDYAKIAEYYAHADRETQELFEESALVIIDFNDAIANGYVELLEGIEAIQGEKNE